MSSISAIISYLEYGRSRFLQSIEGLSRREMTEIPIYEGWTVRDVLAHMIGWDHWVLSTLSLMLQNRADEIPAVDEDMYNRQSIATWQDKSVDDLLLEIQTTHQRILDTFSQIDHVEIDMRRERQGRIITIRSYVIEVMVEHERQHATEIEQWRASLEERIDPAAIKDALAQNQASFREALAALSQADITAKAGDGSWSVKDVTGHLADWETLILKAAQHIYDPSLPGVIPRQGSLDDFNEAMVARRSSQSWQEIYDDLNQTNAALDRFVANLTPGDWKLRGPYPWPSDQGTLAELLSHAAEHYADHINRVADTLGVPPEGFMMPWSHQDSE
jgi:uncharacterized damage-inducible protein DinB